MLVDRYEEAVRAAVTSVLARVEQLQELLGPRELGVLSATALDRLEAYLAIRDDPQEWEAYIQRVVTVLAQASAGIEEQGGLPSGAEYLRGVAERIAIREATECERLIERRGGYRAVQYQIAQRDAKEALQAYREAQRIREKPEIRILPPIEKLTSESLIEDQILAMGGEVEEGDAGQTSEELVGV